MRATTDLFPHRDRRKHATRRHRWPDASYRGARRRAPFVRSGANGAPSRTMPSASSASPWRRPRAATAPSLRYGETASGLATRLGLTASLCASSRLGRTSRLRRHSSVVIRAWTASVRPTREFPAPDSASSRPAPRSAPARRLSRCPARSPRPPPRPPWLAPRPPCRSRQRST
jgi:hypothetical protein